MPLVKENRRDTGDAYSLTGQCALRQICKCRLSRLTRNG